jgi:hypothetical protein
VASTGPQTPPARRLNTRPGQGQTPPAGNAVLASSDEPDDETETTPDAGQTPPDRNGGQPQQRPGTTRQRENADMVEVVIRDQFGRPIRVERVDRRLLKGGPAYPPPPPPYRFYHAYPHGPHGGPAPYPRHGSYGPYGLYR